MRIRRSTSANRIAYGCAVNGKFYKFRSFECTTTVTNRIITHWRLPIIPSFMKICNRILGTYLSYHVYLVKKRMLNYHDSDLHYLDEVVEMD